MQSKKLRYRATNTFAATADTTLTPGDVVEFDGVTLCYGGGEETAPNVRAAIKVGWLVLEENYDENHVTAPQRAAMTFSSPTKMGNPMDPQRKNIPVTVDSDERIVTTASSRTAGVRAGNPMRGPRVVQHESDQEGVVVSTGFFSRAASAKNTPSVDVSSAASSEILYQSKNLQIVPGQGTTLDEYLSRMSPEAREEYLDKLEARKATSDAKLTEIGVAATGPKKRTKSAKVAPPVEEEGVQFNQTGMSQTEKETKIDRDGTSDARKAIAKKLCPDFPDTYDFSQHWKKRLANIQFNFDTRPDVIQAIFAAESDDFKKTLLQEFPAVFA